MNLQGQWRVIVVAIAAMALVPAASRSQGAPPERKVTLVYLEEVSDCATESQGCVITIPRRPVIWTDKPRNAGKAHKVRWEILRSQEDLYYWEIAYKGSDPAANYLGAVGPITCRDKKTTSDKPSGVPDGAVVLWPYSVTVFGCNPDGTKGACLCKSDPVMIIDDGD